MNQLPDEKRIQALNMLVEGSSMRSTARVLGIGRATIDRLFGGRGQGLPGDHSRAVRDVPAKRVECDEIWAYCYSKQKNAPGPKSLLPIAGDIWTWLAIDPDSKLLISWFVGSPGGLRA